MEVMLRIRQLVNVIDLSLLVSDLMTELLERSMNLSKKLLVSMLILIRLPFQGISLWIFRLWRMLKMPSRHYLKESRIIILRIGESKLTVGK